MQANTNNSGKKLFRVALIDDNQTDIKITLKLLEQLPIKFETQVFHDGQEALDHFADTKNQVPDLVLLDVLMPYMDGYAFIKQVKNFPQMRGIPIIVFTSQESLGNVFKAEGATDFVVKSFYADELIEKIRKHLSC